MLQLNSGDRGGSSRLCTKSDEGLDSWLPFPFPSGSKREFQFYRRCPPRLCCWQILRRVVITRTILEVPSGIISGDALRLFRIIPFSFVAVAIVMTAATAVVAIGFVAISIRRQLFRRLRLFRSVLLAMVAFGLWGRRWGGLLLCIIEINTTYHFSFNGVKNLIKNGIR